MRWEQAQPGGCGRVEEQVGARLEQARGGNERELAREAAPQARGSSLSSPFRTSKHEQILRWEQIH